MEKEALKTEENEINKKKFSQGNKSNINYLDSVYNAIEDFYRIKFLNKKSNSLQINHLLLDAVKNSFDSFKAHLDDYVHYDPLQAI